jgi:mRNA-degrading endonuclease toxin of MazEF toxin-antitoxin module
MDTLKPGDVVILNLQGAVQKKIRPAVVLSNEQYHRDHPDVIIGVVTTKLHQATTSTDYLLQDWWEAGLDSPSAFRAFILTRWQREVRQVAGKLSERDWSAVKERVRRALELD